MVSGEPEARGSADDSPQAITDEHLDEYGMRLALRLDRLVFGLHPDEPEGLAHDTRRVYSRRLNTRLP